MNEKKFVDRLDCVADDDKDISLFSFLFPMAYSITSPAKAFSHSLSSPKTRANCRLMYISVNRVCVWLRPHPHYLTATRTHTKPLLCSFTFAVGHSTMQFVLMLETFSLWPWQNKHTRAAHVNSVDSRQNVRMERRFIPESSRLISHRCWFYSMINE